jgi:hypothetical protein
MTERPILFSAPMVRALLAGTKTQTRRPVKGIPLTWLEGGMSAEFVAHPQNRACPYGQAGGRLWVRETFADLHGTGVEHRDNEGRRQRFAFAADCPPGSHSDELRKEYGLKWKPSIHMPRVASRILLEVVSVRVERLQACSEADARAEGAPGGHGSIPGYQFSATPLEHYRHIWESINGAGSWDAKPWVWVVEFRRIDGAVAPEKGEKAP